MNGKRICGVPHAMMLIFLPSLQIVKSGLCASLKARFRISDLAKHIKVHETIQVQHETTIFQ